LADNRGSRRPDGDGDLACAAARPESERQRQQGSGQTAKQFPHWFLHFGAKIVQRATLEKRLWASERQNATMSLAFYPSDRVDLSEKPAGTATNDALVKHEIET